MGSGFDAIASEIYGIPSGKPISAKIGGLIGLRSLLYPQRKCASRHKLKYYAEIAIHSTRGDSNLFSIYFKSMNCISRSKCAVLV